MIICTVVWRGKFSNEAIGRVYLGTLPGERSMVRCQARMCLSIGVTIAYLWYWQTAQVVA
jgi:hypothetical protein